MRCLMTLIACGWLLMTPPFGHDGVSQYSAPFSEWQYSDSFDSAAECKRVHENRIRMARQWRNPKVDINVLTNLMAGRCFPSDAIRIK